MALSLSDARDTSIAPFIKLALAVIKQAIEDATKDIPDQCPLDATVDQIKKWNRAFADRNEARFFLTTDNDGLRFWCRIAGLNVRTVLHYSKGASTDWIGLGRLHHLHQIHPRRALAAGLPSDLIEVAIEDLA